MSVTDSDLLDGFGFVTDVTDYDDVTTPTYGNVTSNVTIPVAQGGNVYQYALPPRELYYYHVVYFSVAIALGVPGNALVIAAYASLRRKSSSDWYILYIAVLDLIICLFRVPTHLAMEIGEWKLGTDALCKLVYWVSQSVITASVFLFAFIAIDRYIKICRPTMRISARFARNCIVGITVGSLLFTIPVFWLYTNSPLANKCVVIASPSALSLMRVYYTALFAAFLVMFVIVVVCYSLLFAKVRRSRKMLKKHRSLENTDCSDEKSTAISSWWWSRWSRCNQVGPVTMSPAVSFTSTSARLDSRSLKGLGAKPVKAARGKGSSTLQVPNQIRGIDLDKTVRLISVRPLQTPKQINLLPRSPTIGAEKNYDSESAKGKVISRSIQRTNLTISTLARNAFADSSYVTTPTTMTSFIDTFDNGKTGESEPSNHFTEEKHSNRHKGKQAVGPNSCLDEKPSNTPSKICLEEESSNLIQYIEEKAVPSKDCLFGEPAAPNHCSKTAGTSQAVLSLDDVTDVETAENGRAEKDQEDDFAVTARTDADPSSQEKVMEEIRTARNGNRVHWERESTRSSEKYNDIETPGIAVTQSFKAAAKRDTRSFRLALLLLLVTAIFVISWIPPYVAMVWYFYVGYTPPLSATDIAVQTYAPTGYILNSFVNPFLYVALSPAFRNTVISLWRKFSRCGRGQG